MWHVQTACNTGIGEQEKGMQRLAALLRDTDGLTATAYKQT